MTSKTFTLNDHGSDTLGIDVTPASVVLADVDFKGSYPPASTHANTNWSSTAFNGSSVGVVDDAAAPNLKAVKAMYPISGAGSTFVDFDFNMSALGIYDVYIEFKVKMGTVAGALKLLKVFSVNGGSDYANFTMQPDWNSAGFMKQIAFGDGTGTENDSGNVVRFDGTNPSWAGRSYPSTALISAPQAAGWNITAGYQTVKVHLKFNSGTTALNEVADGEIYVEVDGDVYMNATGLFNRHYSNGQIDRIGFFGYSQNNAAALDTYLTDIVISTGGFKV